MCNGFFFCSVLFFFSLFRHLIFVLPPPSHCPPSEASTVLALCLSLSPSRVPFCRLVLCHQPRFGLGKSECPIATKI